MVKFVTVIARFPICWAVVIMVYVTCVSTAVATFRCVETSHDVAIICIVLFLRRRLRVSFVSHINSFCVGVIDGVFHFCGLSLEYFHSLSYLSHDVDIQMRSTKEIFGQVWQYTLIYD